MSFHQAVARVTTAQLCRAANIERCSPLALETLADILTRYLVLLAASATSAAESQNRTTTELGDVVVAMAQHGLLVPRFSNNDLNDIDEFIAWLLGPSPHDAITIARVHTQALSAFGQAQGAVLAAQHANQEIIAAPAPAEVSPAEELDWLKMLVNKQLLMGHDKRFKNTQFSAQEQQEVLAIHGGPESIEAMYGLDVGQ